MARLPDLAVGLLIARSPIRALLNDSANRPPTLDAQTSRPQEGSILTSLSMELRLLQRAR